MRYRAACLGQILLVRPGGWQIVLPCGAFELPPGDIAPDVAGTLSPPLRNGNGVWSLDFGVWSLEMNRGLHGADLIRIRYAEFISVSFCDLI